ncbi:MAG TPA: hypothetical protein PLY45_04900 [bacterium]|nr:hypothetical protein [bacterium]
MRKFPLPVPLSSLMNFGALVILFGGIFLLRQLGEGTGPGAAAHEDAVGKAQIEISSVSALPAEETPGGSAAEVSPPPQAEEATATLPVAEAPVEVKAPAVEPTPEKPVVDPRQLKADRLAIKVYEERRSATKRSTLPSLPSAYAEDRGFPLSELDNEAARQRYLAANRGLPGPASGGREVKSPEAGESPSQDFIPFER